MGKGPRGPGVLVRFTDASGTEFTVHDIAFGKPPAAPYRTRLLPHCDPRAHYRVFVSSDGERRSHKFALGEARTLEAADLARQLEGARFLLRPATEAE